MNTDPKDTADEDEDAPYVDPFGNPTRYRTLFDSLAAAYFGTKAPESESEQKEDTSEQDL